MFSLYKKSIDQKYNIIPLSWLYCSKKASKLILNKFLAFKTPLSNVYNYQIPQEYRFDEHVLFQDSNDYSKPTLWIDLTSITFYDGNSIKKYDCQYIKLHQNDDEIPTRKQIRTFLQICTDFIAHKPLGIIGIHCIEGLNTTGFFIVSYLVEIAQFSVNDGLKEFASARYPGIYNDDYVQELYRRYGNSEYENSPYLTIKPSWYFECRDLNIAKENKISLLKSKDHFLKEKKPEKSSLPEFMAGIPDVTPVLNQAIVSSIQKRVGQICAWNMNRGFPGTQPTFLNNINIRSLQLEPYRVSWISIGTRYMMLIQTNGEVYFIDRNNNIFHVNGLCFPHPKNPARNLKETLIDGEMVIDKYMGNDIPKYLISDVVLYDGDDVSQLPFYPKRCSIIHLKIMARQIAEKRLAKPFLVSAKHMWNIKESQKLLTENFSNILCHQMDSLIFRPDEECYLTGRSRKVLRWKLPLPTSMLFELKIDTKSDKEIGCLYAREMEAPYATIQMNEQLKELNNAIIECNYKDDQWVFMRQRMDIICPHSFEVANYIRMNISESVPTKEELLRFIDTKCTFDGKNEYIEPPKKKQCKSNNEARQLYT